MSGDTRSKAAWESQKRALVARRLSVQSWGYVNDGTHEPRIRIAMRTRILRRMKELAGGCSRCNVTDGRILQYHHKDPKTKAGRGIRADLGWARLLPEIDKCVVLCANCHALEHSSRKVFDLPI